jgi:hypothetical protein
LFLTVSNANIPLYPNTLTNGTVSGYGQKFIYQFFGRNTFELNFWRTSVYHYYKVPSVKVTITDPLGNIDQAFYGKKSITAFYEGNYTVNVEYLDFSVVSYSYQLRVCPGYCSLSSCSYNQGYCNNHGACVNAMCICDTNSTFELTTTCDLNIDITPAVATLGTIFIALIVVGVLIVFAIPILICVCCFGCCGLCAYGAAAASVSHQPVVHVHSSVPPQHHHHHHQDYHD